MIFNQSFKQCIVLGAVSFMTMLFTLSPFHRVDAEDDSDKHHFENDALEELVEVRADEDYDKEEAQEMIDRLGNVPERIIRETVNGGAKFLIIDTKLTEQPEFEDLKGKVPRGWEEGGNTWADVPGAGGSVSAARIGYSDYGKDHASINLELHELSHAIDDYALGDETISDLKEFKDIHDKEQTKLFPENVPGNDYYDYPSEYFAETMAMYFLDNTQTDKLQEQAPETYEFIDSLAERILSVDTNSEEGTAQLSWDEVDNADVYAIYRNNEIIGITPDTHFVDNTLTKSDDYKYSVQAGDEDSVLRSTFNRSTKVDVKDQEKAVKALDAPENVNTKIESDNAITLSWDPVSNADYYEITRNGDVIEETESERYFDHGLEEDGEYEYQVRAVHENIHSDPSEKIKFKPEALDEPKNNAGENRKGESTYSFGEVAGKLFKYFFRLKF